MWLALGVALSALTLYLAVSQFAWNELTRALSSAQLEWLAAALAIQILSTLLKAARWQVLLASSTRATNLFPLFAAIVIGQTFNILVPLRLGEIARALLVKQRYAIRGALALSTIGVEKLGDAVILFALLIAILPCLVPPVWFQATILFLAVTTFLAFVILLLLRYRKTTLSEWLERALSLPPRWANLLAPRVKPIFDGADALNNSRAQILFWALGFAAWACAALTNYFAFRAFDLPLDRIAALFLLVVLQAGIALPSLPGKIGVFNYACVLALRVFAVNDAQAFAFSLGLYAVVIVVTVWLGALLFLFNPLTWQQIFSNTEATKAQS